MRVLVPLLGLALLALALWLRPGRERAAEPLAVTVERAPPPRIERAPELALAPALAEDPEEDRAGMQRESLAAPGEVVAGRVEMPWDLPPGERPRVVAHAHRPGAARPESSLSGTVAGDGSFSIPLPGNTRSVSLGLEGRLFSLSPEVEVPAGTLDVVLHPTVFAALHGRVHLPPGLDPATKLGPTYVTAGRQSATYTGPDGSFALVVEPDLPLELVARSEARTVELAEPMLAPVLLDVRQEFPALRPGEVAWIDLTVERLGMVRGFVTDASGIPLGNAMVEVLPAPGLLERPTNQALPVGADGGFVLGPLHTGATEIRVRAPGHRTERRTIVLPAAAQTLLHVALVPGGAVHGVVLGPDGGAYAGAQVQLRGPGLFGGEPVFATQADGEGRFSLSDEEGVLRIVASAAGLADSAPHELRLRPGEEQSDVVLRLRPACSLIGLAFGADRERVRTTLVFTSADGTTRLLFPDDQGRIAEDDLPPGKARIEAGPFHYVDGRQLHSTLTGGMDVELTPEVETRVELNLRPR